MRKRGMLPLLAVAVLVAVGGISCRGFFVNPTLTTINVAPQNASVNIGATAQFTASGVNNDGTTASLHNVTWTTSASTIATVSATGVAKGVSAGSATITATEGTVSGSSTLTVGSSSNTFVISPTNAVENLSTGSVQFTATNNSQIVTNSTTWNSSNASVATFSSISPGLATLQGTGTTTITATFTPSGGTQQTASTNLTVQ